MGYSSGASYLIRAGDPGLELTLGRGTQTTVLDMPGRAVTVGPDGSIIAVMIANEDNLAVQNAVQANLHGASDVYLVKRAPVNRGTGQTARIGRRIPSKAPRSQPTAPK